MKHILSLGAGVQSSAMALMAMQMVRLYRMPDLVRVFSRHTSRAKKLYTKHLEWLKEVLPFPVYNGNCWKFNCRIIKAK